MTLWGYRSRTRAPKAGQAWVRSAIRCCLEAVKRVVAWSENTWKESSQPWSNE